MEENSTGWSMTTVGESKRSVNITGLSYWTCYDVKIAAFTVGEGPFASVAKVRTSENGMVDVGILIFSTFGFSLVLVPGRVIHFSLLGSWIKFGIWFRFFKCFLSGRYSLSEYHIEQYI